MNNTFNISRFGRFFAMEFRQYRNIFLILMGVTLIDLIASMATFSATLQMLTAVDTLEGVDNALAVSMIQDAKLGVSPFRFGGAFGLLILIVPFLLYNFVYHPTKSLTYSMLPASWLEKFMSAWLMCVIFVPFLLFGFSLLVAFIGDLLGAQVSYHALDLRLFLRNFYLPTIAVQSIAFWGAFWFRRRKIGKTILVVASVVIVLIFLASQVGIFSGTAYDIGSRAGKFTVEAIYFIYALVILLWTLALLKFPRTQI